MREQNRGKTDLIESNQDRVSGRDEVCERKLRCQWKRELLLGEKGNPELSI
ncbi:hypothetical protein COLO4_37798 [Corchorus olitorius]|uniref:Uncharacterized protein n=1 Tax=Corchorus olitorius TaxID=93759 RepID=A0A1R3FZ90_9ROSI|nr:hypothetical protein COLO4_37798 [Corchorus olitorius]